MRLKTNRRLILLGASVAVLAAGAFALYFVRNWQKDRMTDAFFAKGQAAFKVRHYYDAMINAAQFINRVKSHPAKRAEPRYADALLTYAESRRLIEENDDRNIREAIPFYQQYRDLRPDDAKTRFTLLKALNEVGLSVEARDLALRDLPKGSDQKLDPTRITADQAPTLRELALAQRRLVKGDAVDPELNKSLDALLALNPLDVYANLIRMEVLSNSGQRAQVRALADALRADHPEDPAALLIAAYSREISLDGGPPTSEDNVQHHELLCRAAGLDPKSAARVQPVTYSDELFVLQLVNAFDRSRAFDFSLAVLRDAADRVKSSSIERLLVRRLWQEGDNEAVLARTAALDPANLDSQAELLGFRALCLLSAKHADQAAAIAKALSAREGDFRAGGWGAAIPLMDPATQPKPAAAVSAWKAIVDPRNNPNEPVFMAYYGLALSDAGRSEEARRAWADAQALPLGESWFFPSLRIAESYLADGRINEALKAAEDARAISGNRAAVLVTLFEAHAARIQRGSRADPTPAKLLEQLELILPEFAKATASPAERALADRLIVPHVVFLARSDRAEDAKAVGLEAIRRDPAPAPDVLQRLAAVSAGEHLGFENEAMQRVEATGGAVAPVLFVRATELAAAGKPDQGLELLRSAAKQKPDDLPLQLAVARYLERIGTADATAQATAAWIKLGDAHPDDLNIQKACLQAPSAAADSAFIERSFQRYAKLLGAEPGAGDVIAYTARARAAMWGAPTRSGRDKAISLMDAVVRAQPTLVEPKVQLAAYLSVATQDIKPDLNRAASQLSDAATLEPHNAGIQLNLAQIYQRQRDFTRSREVLTRIINDDSNDGDSIRAAAELLIAQGEPGPVASDALSKVLTRMDTAGAKPPPAMLVALAEAWLAQRQDPKAAELYGRLAEGAANDADSIYATARYYALHSDDAKSAAVIAKLDSIQLEPGTKDYALARLSAETGKLDDAIASYKAALKAAPARSDIWRQYVQLLLRNKKYPEAKNAVEEAVKALPGDSTIAALKTQVGMVQTAQVRTAADPQAAVDARELLAAIAADPAQTEAADALQAWDAAVAKKQIDSPETLAAIADKFPSFVPLQLVIAGKLVNSSPDRAAILARRAMSTSPNDPTPAKAAAEIYLSMGRWSDMLAAAQEWRQRDTARTAEPDVAVAQAYLKLNQFDKGLQTLAPRIEYAAAHPDEPSSLGVLNIQTRLLLGARREGDARALLTPLLDKSAGIRVTVWLSAAAEEAPSLDIAKLWIEQLMPLLPPESVEERLAVVSSYPLLAARFSKSPADPLREELFQKAVALLQTMTQDPKLGTAATWETLGVVQHTRNNLDAAEAAYRKAIELDPDRAVSLNNLAGILLESRGKADEALPLSLRAVEATPKPVASNLDTLASIYAAIGLRQRDKGDTAGAVRNFKLAAERYGQVSALAPAGGEPMSRQAQMLELAGDQEAAANCYDQMLNLEGLRPELLPAVRNNLAMCLIRLDRTPADRELAVTLATEATRLAPDQPAYLDTLGWCQLKAEHLPEAAASFRKAQAKSAGGKPLPSAAIGLATVLAQGTPQEQAQAKTILDGIDPKSLDAEDAARYHRAVELRTTPR